METFMKAQIKILDEVNITYYSIDIELDYSEKEQRYKKNPRNMPSYKNIKLKKYFTKSKCGTIIPLGINYDYLIGIDVDNKGDTLIFYKELMKQYGYDQINTFFVKTINDGYHYYFKLNEEQQKGLIDFMASTSIIFSTVEHPVFIDVKYTNQVFFGSSYLTTDDGDILKYEIMNNVKPDILPDFLYTEILDKYKKSINNVKNKPQKEKTDLQIKNNNSTEKFIVNRLKLYLDCLDLNRFDNRDDWLVIGAIIFNESHNYELFKEYSKKSKKYDKDGCIKLWNSFNENHEKQVSIKRLINMAQEDCKIKKYNFAQAKLMDTKYLLEKLFFEQESDHYLGLLFGHLYFKEKFTYDEIKQKWYFINDYGLYRCDERGSIIKKHISSNFTFDILKLYEKIVGFSKNEEDKIKFNNKYNKICIFCENYKTRENVFTSAKLYCASTDLYKLLDTTSKFVIGFDNGVYDLQTNIFRDAKPEEYVSKTVGRNYIKADPENKKKAYEILRSMFGNQETFDYFMKTVSLCLIGENPEEKFFVWLGRSGANGKGLLKDIISACIGEYMDVIPSSYFYKSSITNSQSADPIMVSKKTCRYLISSELDRDEALKSSTIKTISGNDTLSVRDLYSKPETFIPPFKLILQSNVEPKITDIDGGIKRRIVIIPFIMTFVDDPREPNERQIDKTLKYEINTNKKYVNEFFEILLDYYILYKKYKLIMPKDIREATDKFINDNDPVSEWLKENIIKTNNNKNKILSSVLYNNFEQFNETNINVSTTYFKNLMLQNGVMYKRLKEGIFFFGIKFKEE